MQDALPMDMPHVRQREGAKLSPFFDAGTRPTSSRREIQALACQLLPSQLEREGCLHDYADTPEELADWLEQKLGVSGYISDGESLARSFDRDFGLNLDEMQTLAEVYDHLLGDITDACIAQWVHDHDIRLEIPVGTEVFFNERRTGNYEELAGTVTQHRAEDARYVVRVPALGHDENSGLLLTPERVRLEPTKMAEPVGPDPGGF